MLLTTLDVLNLVDWYKTKRADPDKPLNFLPLKIQWELKKNIDKILPIFTSYTAFQNECETELQNEYANDEKSELDKEDTTIRKIKNEYLEEYQNRVKELQTKLNDILRETNEISWTYFNIDNFLENIDDNCKLTIDDLEILNFLNKENNKESI